MNVTEFRKQAKKLSRDFLSVKNQLEQHRNFGAKFDIPFQIS